MVVPQGTDAYFTVRVAPVTESTAETVCQVCLGAAWTCDGDPDVPDASTLAPAAPAVPGRFGVPPRPARPARTVTVIGTSGSGLVGLTAVPGMQTDPAPTVARDAGDHQVAAVTLAAFKAPRP